MKLSNETKSWLKYITMPHLLTMLLMSPVAPLWLVSGVVGVFCCFPQDKTYIQLVSGCLLIIVISLIMGYFWISSHKKVGKILISLALYFWFLAGFFHWLHIIKLSIIKHHNQNHHINNKAA